MTDTRGGAGVDEAWERLRNAVVNAGSYGHESFHEVIARHRSIVEAAIRAEGLDVDRLTVALGEVFDHRGPYTMRQMAEAVIREYDNP